MAAVPLKKPHDGMNVDARQAHLPSAARNLPVQPLQPRPWTAPQTHPTATAQAALDSMTDLEERDKLLTACPSHEEGLSCDCANQHESLPEPVHDLHCLMLQAFPAA